MRLLRPVLRDKLNKTSFAFSFTCYLHLPVPLVAGRYQRERAINLKTFRHSKSFRVIPPGGAGAWDSPKINQFKSKFPMDNKSLFKIKSNYKTGNVYIDKIVFEANSHCYFSIEYWRNW